MNRGKILLLALIALLLPVCFGDSGLVLDGQARATESSGKKKTDKPKSEEPPPAAKEAEDEEEEEEPEETPAPEETAEPASPPPEEAKASGGSSVIYMCPKCGFTTDAEGDCPKCQVPVEPMK